MLSALEPGPLRTTEDFTDRIRALLLALANRQCLCVLQFVYSHVGFPPRNAAIDALVTAHLDEDAPPLDHDGAAIWYVDVVRAIRRFLLLRWLSSVDDARTRLCGKARAPLRQLTPLPRADQVLLSRCRTDSLPDLGTYRLRLGIASSPACRWCAGLPPASMDTMPPAPLPAPPRSPARQALPEAPDTFPCPHCPVTPAHASSLRRHMDNAHPGDPRPAHSPFVCPCGKAFTSNKGRANHHRTCASWMQLHPPEPARYSAPQTRSLE